MNVSGLWHIGSIFVITTNITTKMHFQNPPTSSIAIKTMIIR